MTNTTGTSQNRGSYPEEIKSQSSSQQANPFEQASIPDIAHAYKQQAMISAQTANFTPGLMHQQNRLSNGSVFIQQQDVLHFSKQNFDLAMKDMVKEMETIRVSES